MKYSAKPRGCIFSPLTGVTLHAVIVKSSEINKCGIPFGRIFLFHGFQHMLRNRDEMKCSGHEICTIPSIIPTINLIRQLAPKEISGKVHDANASLLLLDGGVISLIRDVIGAEPLILPLLPPRGPGWHLSMLRISMGTGNAGSKISDQAKQWRHKKCFHSP